MGGLKVGVGEALKKPAGPIGGLAWAAPLTQPSRVPVSSAMGMHNSQDAQLSMPAGACVSSEPWPPASTCASIGQSAGMALAEPLVAI